MKDDEVLMVERLLRRIENLIFAMEKSDIADFVALYDHPRRLLFYNFLAGLFRGLGIAIGFTILGAALIYFLRSAVVQHLPVIGKFIADLIVIINRQMGKP